ncbi:MAG: aldehyde ferredoxin oxidoreductase family protein [Thermoplasmata archaeon]
MPELFGYWGRLARIDLSSEHVIYEDIPDAIMEKFLGAKGIAVHYICTEVEPRIDPLTAENKIAISVGAYQGTVVPSSGRFCTATKSPLTGIFLDTYAGGNFGHALKESGFDLIIIEGSSDHPTYITVGDGTAQIKDASEVWGLDTQRAEKALRSLEGEEVRCVTIGPAGENRVLISCLMSDSRRASGRGGCGAVFGSKNLKGIVAKGGLDIAVHDKKKLHDVIRRFNSNVRAEKGKGKSFYKHGTSGILEGASERDRLPTRNYQEAEFEHASEISGEAIHDRYDVEPVPCCPCPIACPATLDGKWDRPEYETLAMLGSNTGNKDLDAIIRANMLCNELGLDTISTGGVLGFAMECSQRGSIREKIRFGHPHMLKSLILKIAFRKGIGNLLAKGVRRAAEELGEDASDMAVHAKGLEIPAWDPRGKLGHGLAYMTADIGGSHLRDFYSTKRIPNESAVDIVERIIDGQNFTVERDNYIICTFAVGEMTSEMRREAFEAITGEPLSEERLRDTAERVWTLTRLFNVREGISRVEDRLPRRFVKEALPTGVARGCRAFVSEEDMNLALDRYYELRGWDEKGIPLPETLKELGIAL